MPTKKIKILWCGHARTLRNGFQFLGRNPTKYTQKSASNFLLNQPKSDCVYHSPAYTSWNQTKFVWSKINRKVSGSGYFSNTERDLIPMPVYSWLTH